MNMSANPMTPSPMKPMPPETEVAAPTLIAVPPMTMLRVVRMLTPLADRAEVFMVPNTPGSGYDLTARAASKAMEDAGLAQNVEVFNVPGAVAALAEAPELVLVDGNRLPDWPYAARAVIGGDATIACISAAAILAKVTRDREMQALEADFPGYGFARHKGYGTAQHSAALDRLGPCALHRRSFAPVRRACGER